MFLSVEWSSGNFPEKLVIAMKNYNTVFSAWDEDKLVGMVCVMDDGVMNAYINYLIVHPDYQLKGIGKELIKRVKTHYKDYLRIAVITVNNNVKFYEYSGFEKTDDKTPLFITDFEN